MTKYVAFRIDTQTIRDNKVVDGWFIRGQREDSLNWDLLNEAEDEEDAKAMAKGYRITRGTGHFIPIYNPSGYAYMYNGQML